MTIQFACDSARLRGPQPPVWVRVGALDWVSVGQAREVLSQSVVRTASSVMVDLAGLDDRHELTGFALLAELSRHVVMNGGVVTAVNAPSRLAAHLVAFGVPVSREAMACPVGALIVEVGALPALLPGGTQLRERGPLDDAQR